jgi:hypothetical protein
MFLERYYIPGSNRSIGHLVGETIPASVKRISVAKFANASESKDDGLQPIIASLLPTVSLSWLRFGCNRRTLVDLGRWAESPPYKIIALLYGCAGLVLTLALSRDAGEGACGRVGWGDGIWALTPGDGHGDFLPSASVHGSAREGARGRARAGEPRLSFVWRHSRGWSAFAGQDEGGADRLLSSSAVLCRTPEMMVRLSSGAAPLAFAGAVGLAAWCARAAGVVRRLWIASSPSGSSQ